MGTLVSEVPSVEQPLPQLSPSPWTALSRIVHGTAVQLRAAIIRPTGTAMNGTSTANPTAAKPKPIATPAARRGRPLRAAVEVSAKTEASSRLACRLLTSRFPTSDRGRCSSPLQHYVLAIGLITGTPIILGLEPREIVLLLLSMGVSILTFD